MKLFLSVFDEEERSYFGVCFHRFRSFHNKVQEMFLHNDLNQLNGFYMGCGKVILCAAVTK